MSIWNTKVGPKEIMFRHVSSTNKTDSHDITDITEILFVMTLNTITLTLNSQDSIIIRSF